MEKRRLAFIYPGQGSQYVGMASTLSDKSEAARKVFKRVNELFQNDLQRIMFEGPEESLKQTLNTQPAILIHSMAIHDELVSRGIEPAIVAGHSLGEYSALYAAGVLKCDAVMKLVERRAELMQEAGNAHPGAMAAIIGLDEEKIDEFCREAQGIAIIANYNAPGQTVISGEKDVISGIVEKCREAGAKRALELPVSGAFHSPLMQDAANDLAKVIDDTDFEDPTIPVVTNVDGKAHTSGQQIRENLKQQMTSSVLWMQSVHTIIGHGVDAIVEVGPGKVLSGLIKRIEKEVETENVDAIADADKLAG